jgi:hypothetical protein
MARCRKEKSSDAGVKFFEISRDQYCDANRAVRDAESVLRKSGGTACHMSESVERGTRPARPLWRRATAFRSDALPYLISPRSGVDDEFRCRASAHDGDFVYDRPLVCSRPALMAWAARPSLVVPKILFPSQWLARRVPARIAPEQAWRRTP